MLYEGEVAPGMRPVEAQIAISFPTSPNLLQDSHDVSREPGKNFCGEWMSSAVQPTSAISVRASRERREIYRSSPATGEVGESFVNPESQSREEIGKKSEEVPRASTWLAS